MTAEPPTNPVAASPATAGRHQTPRNNGLDTLRAVAIILVFAYHYMIFVSGEPTFGWVSKVGWVGVDLFFVLSGYLIGNQLFSGVARGEAISLRAFYARRALRTWPAFWFVLAAYFLFPTLVGGNAPPPLWRFLTFTQNLGLRPGTAFSHAWSLCIEEQFYLILPLMLILGLRWFPRRVYAWSLIATGISIGVVSRAWLCQSYGREGVGDINGYYPNIYYATLCRFDEFLPGVGVALLKNLHPNLWQGVVRNGPSCFWGGIAGSILLGYGILHFYQIEGYGYGFFMTSFGYSLLALSFSMLVVAALSPSCWLHRLRIPGAYPLAVWSYSIYLSHKAVAHIVADGTRRSHLSSSATWITVAMISVAIGAALYAWIEKPFLRLRDQYFPSSFSPGSVSKVTS